MSKSFVFIAKEQWEMEVEYYINADTEEEARKAFEKGDDGDYVDVEETFVTTISQELKSVEEQE